MAQSCGGGCGAGRRAICVGVPAAWERMWMHRYTPSSPPTEKWMPTLQPTMSLNCTMTAAITATCIDFTLDRKRDTMALPLHERALETDSTDLVRMTLLEGGASRALVDALIPSRPLQEGEQYRFHFDMT